MAAVAAKNPHKPSAFSAAVRSCQRLRAEGYVSPVSECLPSKDTEGEVSSGMLRSRKAKGTLPLTSSKQLCGDNIVLRGVPPSYAYQMFVFQRRLGSGGNGVVYAVKDKLDQQSYALKMVTVDQSPFLSNTAYLAHVAVIQEELQIMSTLRSSRILLYCDAFHSPAVNTIYTKSTLVDGITLHDYLFAETDEQRLMRFPRILRELLDALAVVHVHGIAHRDIKPANIMLQRPDGGLVLIDFGLACMLCRPVGQPYVFHGPYIVEVQAAGGTPTLADWVMADLWSAGVTLAGVFLGMNGDLLMAAFEAQYGTVQERMTACINSVEVCIDAAAVTHPELSVELQVVKLMVRAHSVQQQDPLALSSLLRDPLPPVAPDTLPLP